MSARSRPRRGSVASGSTADSQTGGAPATPPDAGREGRLAVEALRQQRLHNHMVNCQCQHCLELRRIAMDTGHWKEIQ